MLRSIDKICMILTDVRQMSTVWGYGCIRDKTFATCSLPWPSVLIRCGTLQPCQGRRSLCNNCIQHCHQARGHTNMGWDWKYSVRHWLLPFTSRCSCNDDGSCKLKAQDFPNPYFVIYKCFCLSILALFLALICCI